jgi:hypothetical protein
MKRWRDKEIERVRERTIQIGYERNGETERR